MERQWMTLDQIKEEYASNDYNPELLLQHLLHHVEASSARVPEKIRKVESGFRGFFLRKEARAYRQGWNECRAVMIAASDALKGE